MVCGCCLWCACRHERTHWWCFDIVQRCSNWHEHKTEVKHKEFHRSELVGSDAVSPATMWTNCFLDAQGCASNDTISCQDNESAILPEKNGKASSSERTKHIDIQCFFIEDRIDNEELCVDCFPSDMMLADFFTEPSQGAKFTEFRDKVLNVN